LLTASVKHEVAYVAILSVDLSRQSMPSVKAVSQQFRSGWLSWQCVWQFGNI